MASSVDRELSSASSAEELKRRKRSSEKKKLHKEKTKKSKRDSEKREKRHKSKKHKKSTSDREPETILTQSSPDMAEAVFGPALPPHLVKQITAPVVQNMIGPIMPSVPLLPDPVANATTSAAPTSAAPDVSDDDSTSTFGPLPVDATAMSAVQIELEERALSLKLAAINGATGTDVEQKEREEWMLELPEVGLKTGLAAINNLKRTFHQGKERPDFSDRSSWTKTPQSEAATTSGKRPHSSTHLAQAAEAIYRMERDAQQESIAKKHKKKHKRDKSLVELHQKKLRKEKRKKEKELAASGAKPERRPFSRDVDLKLNKIDSQQTKHIVNKAKILNTKFSTGQSKYL